MNTPAEAGVGDLAEMYNTTSVHLMVSAILVVFPANGGRRQFQILNPEMCPEESQDDSQA